jgi:hypothetical protein
MTTTGSRAPHLQGLVWCEGCKVTPLAAHDTTFKGAQALHTRTKTSHHCWYITSALTCAACPALSPADHASEALPGGPSVPNTGRCNHHHCMFTALFQVMTVPYATRSPEVHSTSVPCSSASDWGLVPS